PVDEPDGSPPSYVTSYPSPTVTSFFVEQDPPAGVAASGTAPSVLITTFAVPDTVVISLVAPAAAVEPAPTAAPEAPGAVPDPTAETPEVEPAPAPELDEGANHLLDAFTRYAESTDDDLATAEEPAAAGWDPEVETEAAPGPGVPAAASPSVPDGAAARTADAHLDEGNVYFNVGQYILAIECYSSAIDLQPDLIAAYYNRANARTRLGHYGQALADYDRALELEPNDADALNNRGMLHLYRADYASAIRDFEVALSIDPGDTTIMVNRGLAYLHSGNGAAALVDFEAAAAADPGDAAAYYGCAQATATLGDRDVALRHLTRAFDLDPAYVREAAADPKLASLQGDPEFLKLLRDTGSRST
ncbi:MAG TPA: tetratricopeptide repeat protein, partial [Tepidiformaceae bacterium]|nr:tetratricopeptide repeat protein [Tepidiformaceae bacterium]